MKNTLVLSVLTFFSLMSTNGFADTPHYMAFIDAGSSGSRIHVFQYELNSGLPNIKDVFSGSIKPGLSSFATDPSSAGSSLKKLLDDTAVFLNKNAISQAETQISVLATAGMRLLPEETQDAIYKNVKQYIEQNYQYTIKEIKTISGQMEGVYGWLDVNYLSGNFQNNLPTVGSIDMGGASTQIAFATSVPQANTNNLVALKINQKNYTIFSKSFLGLGQDQSFATMIKSDAAGNCFPQNYHYDNANTGHFTLSGCAPIYADLIEKHRVAEEVNPGNEQPFVAYSSIYFTFNFFNVQNTPDQATVEARIHEVCSKDWEQLKKDYSQIADKYLSGYCATMVYQDQLLYNTYKLQGNQLKIANNINGTDLDWTLGAALFNIINVQN